MSENTASLTRKISSAGDLQSVVRTMKALAASSIGQYDKSVRALGDYYRTVELGLGACFRKSGPMAPVVKRKGQTDAGAIGAVVFGSDQGLVGQFNDVVADYAVKTLAALPGKPEVWAVGDRVHARLVDAGLPVMGIFAVPNSVQAITPLVGQIQIESEARRAKGEYARLYVFHNRPKSGSLYEPVSQRLLPLDAPWQEGLAKLPWPTKLLPEVMCSVRSSANIFSSPSSAPVPNPLPVKTRAVWPRWNAPIRTLMICWRLFTPPSTEYARRALTRNYSM